MIINITNGDYLNAKLSKENEGEFFPFREAIIQGEVTQEVFSDEFIQNRAKSLGVSQDEYRQKSAPLFNFITNHKSYKKLKLWFGKDTFCQLNLLTLLALFEQINYDGEIILNLICDETGEVLQENVKIELGQYFSIYKDVLISKQMPISLGVIEKRAIDLYFDYLSPNGKLINLVKENQNLSQNELVSLLLENTKEYGLSDLNIIELIERASK